MFKKGPMNIVAVFTCQAVARVQPRQWKCGACGHEGWLKTVSTCDACGEVGHLELLPRPGICAMLRESDGKADSWDDVAGAELNCESAIKARRHETEQFKAWTLRSSQRRSALGDRG